MQIYSGVRRSLLPLYHIEQAFRSAVCAITIIYPMMALAMEGLPWQVLLSDHFVL